MPKLYLIPNSITEDDPHVLPIAVVEAISQVRVFFVEEPKSARRLLKMLNAQFLLQECQFLELSEHTKAAETKEYVDLLKKGDAGIISESGCPCVADPGADLVLLAHRQGIDIIPLVGPSSILLALMASGLNGQSFAFNGYLPKASQDRRQKIKMLEKRAQQEGQTQIFMDTPYRNQDLFNDILAVCDAKTILCIACHIGGADQLIKTRSISEWKQIAVDLSKKPALFLLGK